MVTYCDVIDKCADCPRYGDDCDGDKRNDDLISRADAIEAVRKVVIDNDVVDALKALPSAEAVQGEWIECLAYNPDLDADVPYIKCDQCGHRPYFGGSYRPKYCEECGAKMKGGGSE